jgi:hypothetical protein
MPFSNNTTNLIGKRLLFETHYGNGWMLYTPGQPLQPIEFPPPFEGSLVEIIVDEGEVRALICKTDVTIADHHFAWGAFIARSDLIIDLNHERVVSNLLLSKEKPTLSGEHPYGHPGFVKPNSEINIRGFGILSLSKITPKDET